MSSFTCEKCGMAIVDAPGGYITECQHYPKSKTNASRKSGDVELDKIKELFNIK